MMNTELFDRDGKELNIDDWVEYRGKNYQFKYFKEWGCFGLLDEKYNRPVGRGGSSTKYEPYFMTKYHLRQMKKIN